MCKNIENVKSRQQNIGLHLCARKTLSRLGDVNWLKRCAHGGCRLSCLFPWGITNVRPYGNEIVNTQHSLCTDQWCALRPPVLGQDLSETNKIGLGLGLAGLVLCCETRSVTLVVIMILKDTATFQVQFIVSLFGSSNITTVEEPFSSRVVQVDFLSFLGLRQFSTK